MKKLLGFLIAGILLLTGSSSVNAQDTLPCDKGLFRTLCNPNLKIVEKCYDCDNLISRRERCFPALKQLDITDFLSSKRWNCTEHEYESPVHTNSLTNEEIFDDLMNDTE